MKILLIEDNQNLQKLVINLLKLNSYEANAVSCGEDGLKEITAQNPDLILLDIVLPDMDGLELLERLVKEHPAIPPNVIIITAHSTEERIIQALRLGAKDFILKPFNNNDLIERIDRVKRELELKKAEERLLKEKASFLEELKNIHEMKQKFLDMIVHNLKNPLNSVLGFSGVLATRELSFKDKMYYYRIIEEQGKRMLIMLDDLLKDSFYKEGNIPLQFSNVNLKNLLELSLSNNEIKAKEKNIEFIPEIESVDIKCDGEKLVEVIENLLDNSFKFTSEGGKITLKISKDPSGVKLHLSDNGIGIPQNMLDKVFLGTPLVSRKGLKGERGTGLGLAFCKKIVDLHGGKIIVTSVEGKGSEFNIFLPITPPENTFWEPIPEEEAEMKKNDSK